MKMPATATFLPVDICKCHNAKVGSNNVAMSPTVLRAFKLTVVWTMSMQMPSGGGMGRTCFQKKDIGVH